MFCNKCGKEIMDGSNYCNHCGHKIDEVPKRKISRKFILFTSVLYILYLFVIFLFAQDSSYESDMFDPFSSYLNYSEFLVKFLLLGIILPFSCLGFYIMKKKE